MCWADEANYHKIDWSKVPAKAKADALAIMMEKKLSAKHVALRGSGTGDGDVSQLAACKAAYGDGNPVEIGIDSKAINGHFFNDKRAFVHGYTPVARCVQTAEDGDGVDVTGVGTAAVQYTCDKTGNKVTEYYPDSYLVEKFTQPLLSVGKLLSQGHKVDFASRTMVTRAGTTVRMNDVFDVQATYLEAHFGRQW